MDPPKDQPAKKGLGHKPRIETIQSNMVKCNKDDNGIKEHGQSSKLQNMDDCTAKSTPDQEKNDMNCNDDSKSVDTFFHDEHHDEVIAD